MSSLTRSSVLNKEAIRTTTAVFAELAQKLRGQVPLYEVDCEADKAVCRAEGVPGYPQLILFVHLWHRLYEDCELILRSLECKVTQMVRSTSTRAAALSML